jgi:hypothetical protein
MKKLLFILPLIILISCSVQKRKYQKGFYVHTKTKAHLKKENTNNISKNLIAELPVTNLNILNNNEQEQINVSAENQTAILKNLKKPSLFSAPDSCDIIIFKNGSEISAKVLEISPTQVKYKKCDMINGPLYVADKSDVFMVKYMNGSKEVFKTENTNTIQTQNFNEHKIPKTKRQVHPAAIATLVFGIISMCFAYFAFIFAMVGLFTSIGFAFLIIAAVLSILTLVLSEVALGNIRRFPEKFKGKGLAIPGRVFAIVILSICALVLILTAIY